MTQNGKHERTRSHSSYTQTFKSVRFSLNPQGRTLESTTNKEKLNLLEADCYFRFTSSKPIQGSKKLILKEKYSYTYPN